MGSGLCSRTRNRSGNLHHNQKSDELVSQENFMVDSICINAGGGVSGIFGADAYYSGGQSASSNTPVDGKGVYYPANQEVY